MTLTDIIQSKAFIIIGITALVAAAVYFSGLYSVIKRVLYDILWNHVTKKFDYNNFAKLMVLATTLYLLLGTHVQIKFNPFNVVYEKPSTELFAVLFLYTLGESAFKLWFNRAPAPADNKIEVKSETTTINTPTVKPKAKPAPIDEEEPLLG